MATQDVKVPDIGDFADIPVIEVHVAAGDTIGEEDPIVTLESDKATMDVPSPAAGVVAELKVEIGDNVSEGSLLLTLEEGGPDQGRVDDSLAAPAAHEAAAVSDGAAAKAAAGGNGGSEAEAALLAPAIEEAASTSGAPPAQAPGGNGGAPAKAPAGGPVYASPSVRRLARELQVDLTRVPGSGRKGRIVPDDVRAFAEGGPPEAPAAPAKKAAPAPTGGGGGLDLLPWPTPDFAKFGPVETQPLSRIKKISGANLARNWVLIPHVNYQDEADITDLEAFRKQTNEDNAKSGARVTLLGMVLKALVTVLQRYPEFNASLQGDELVLKRYYHLGFAADTPQGLVVPVIRDVDQKGILAISAEMRELSGQAREGKLGPAAMQGGTFTVSSLGGIGGTAFAPIINAPEVAILGMTRSQTKPVWTGAEFVPRLMQPLSLSFDHRVVDGAAAARFVTYLAEVLQDMRRVLL